MDRAQGAIDAARAAGADQYAATEYSLATTALAQSNEAVAARDYRLALNYALESNEHAQNAARDTANTKARMRADVDRAIADLGVLLAQGDARVASAERARVAGALLTPPADDLAAVRGDLQKAGEAVAAGDYLGANAGLEGLRARIEQALAAVDAAVAAQSPQRRR